MIIYSEEKNGHKSVFIKTILDNNNNELSKRKVTIPLFQIEKDNFLYFVLYDDNMKVISSVYEYLNYDLKESPLTDRKSVV